MTTTTTLTYSSDTYVLNVVMTQAPVAVTVQTARDAYQLAVADGFVGTRAEWEASLEGPQGAKGETGAQGPQGDQGPTGANAEHVILTLAEYLALPLETQTDGRWYIIPKTN